MRTWKSSGIGLLLAAAFAAAPAGQCQTDAVDSLLQARRHNGLAGSPHQVLSELAGAQAMDEVSRAAWACLLCHPSPPNDEPPTLWDDFREPANLDLHSPNLCLSCHDGLLATGFTSPCVGRRQVELSQLRPPASPESAGHLFAFADSSAGAPSTIAPRDLPVVDHRVSCTTCHDPHSSQQEFMLRKDPEAGELCLACHRLEGWSFGSHGGSPDQHDEDLRQIACAACHRIHAPDARPALLKGGEAQTCLGCHDGSVDCEDEVASAEDLTSVFEKPYRHPVGFMEGAQEGGGWVGFFAGSGEPYAVECSSCHNPHAAGHPEDPDVFGGLDGSLRGVEGVSPLGMRRPAEREAEICMMCHGFTADGPLVTRNPWGTGRDVAEDFSLANRSFHPVLGTVSGAGSPSLKLEAGGTARGNLPAEAIGLQTLNCSDCHGNDDPLGPQGPHASNIPGLLKAEFDSYGQGGQADPLCMQCHEGGVLFSSQSWRWHSLHADAGFSCAACHDPHGSRTLDGLLNLDRRPWAEAVEGEFLIEKIDLHTGTCTIKCHGYVHKEVRW